MKKYIVSLLILAFFASVLTILVQENPYRVEIYAKPPEKGQEKEKTPEPIQTEIFKDVKKVFVHFPGDYSIMYLEGKELKVQKVEMNSLHFIRNNSNIGSHTEIKILMDAEPNNMWMEIQMWNSYYFKVVIHVDSADAFGGASFKYKVGKQNREGQTEVVR